MDLGGIAVALLVVFAIALTIAAFAFWIWALVDAIRVPDDSLYQSGTKLVWVLVIVLIHWIGAIVYVVVGRPPRGAVERWDAGREATIPPRPPDAPPPPP